MAAVPRFAYVKTTIVARLMGDVNVEYVVDVVGMQYAGISGGKSMRRARRTPALIGRI